MHLRYALAVVVPVALASLAVPRSSGILPGEFLVPPSPSSALPSCGQCHDQSPNANGPVQVLLSTSARVLDAGAATTVTAAVTGGPGLGFAGFCLESDRGTLVAGANTRTTAAGDAITHVSQASASFAFAFQAPAAPGLVRWTAAGQSVNLDLAPSGDSWGFHGPDSNLPGVAYRLFVNAAGVQALGRGCNGSDGHEPLLGASAALAIAQTFVTELHSVPPAVPGFCALGVSTTSAGGIPLPFDLAILGAPGCLVRTDHLLVQSGITGGAGSGGGTLLFAWPIPNDPGLRGLTAYFQGFALDAGANGGITASNALQATVQ